MRKICLIGDGGHSRVVKEIIYSMPDWELAAILDDRYPATEKKSDLLYGPVQYAIKLAANEELSFVLAIGKNETRKILAESLAIPADRYATLIHPASVISPSARIGIGTIIMPGAIINADSKVGVHAIINTGAIIEHDNMIGDFVHVAPGATLTGTVKVGEGSQVSAGATVIPNIEIGKWSVAGAGAVVIRDIPDHARVAGNPAKSIKQMVGERL